MKSFATKELVLWLLIFLAGGALLYATFVGRTDWSGKTAPPLALKTTEGQLVDLQEDLPGKVVVLNVYATWCGPCVKEIPEFASFWTQAQAKDPDGVRLYGVVYESGPPAKARADSRKLGVNYPILVGSDPVAQRYELNTYPTTIIIDADGHVHSRVEGVMDKEGLEALVERAKHAH